jgi:ATP-binding cassette subfamily A (ABC1) protein 3
MTFQLPGDASAQFKDFFNLLDSNLEELGIRSYGVGITTLEEVFLKIGKGEKEQDDEEEEFRKFTMDKFDASNNN